MTSILYKVLGWVGESHKSAILPLFFWEIVYLVLLHFSSQTNQLDQTDKFIKYQLDELSFVPAKTGWCLVVETLLYQFSLMAKCFLEKSKKPWKIFF